jgi:NAD(P)-dependent dehydrogenase (short-subunit alcohol dehydrogenase family)
MARVFITGSSDGLGLMAAPLLVDQGHRVTLHARNAVRAQETRDLLPQAEAVVAGDLSSIAEMRRVAEQVNALGKYDAASSTFSRSTCWRHTC